MRENVMDVIIVMCLGVLVGKKISRENGNVSMSFLQTICTMLLIFSMGVLLGSRNDFLSEIVLLDPAASCFS